jgi:hypothetical protein
MLEMQGKQGMLHISGERNNNTETSEALKIPASAAIAGKDSLQTKKSEHSISDTNHIPPKKVKLEV